MAVIVGQPAGDLQQPRPARECEHDRHGQHVLELLGTAEDGRTGDEDDEEGEEGEDKDDRGLPAHVSHDTGGTPSLGGEEMYRTIEAELRMTVCAIRRGYVPPASLVAAVQTLCESAEHGWGYPEEGEAPAVDVLDPWYLLHPHPVCSA